MAVRLYTSIRAVSLAMYSSKAKMPVPAYLWKRAGHRIKAVYFPLQALQQPFAGSVCQMALQRRHVP